MERPILFRPDMVKAILDGRKTQTRRVVKHLPALGEAARWIPMLKERPIPMQRTIGDFREYCPYGKPGSRLWVRETFVLENTWTYHGAHEIPTDGRPIQKHEHAEGSFWLIPHYRATEPEPHIIGGGQDDGDDTTKWKPSIHMPRWACRLVLEITKVRVERIQDISEEDAKAEGVRFTDFGDDYGYMKQQKPGFHIGEVSSHDQCHQAAKTCFAGLWHKIHAKDGCDWAANPWVWVIEFAPLPPVPSQAGACVG